jgi:hypothetical protein
LAVEFPKSVTIHTLHPDASRNHGRFCQLTS